MSDVCCSLSRTAYPPHVNLKQLGDIRQHSYRLLVPSGPLTVGSLGAVAVGTVLSFGSNQARRIAVRKKLLYELLTFLISDFVFVIGTSLLCHFAPALATDGAGAPNHRDTPGVAVDVCPPSRSL